MNSTIRLTKEDLLKLLEEWSGFVKKPLKLVAFGGTALSLMGLKDSTKDIDFCVETKKELKQLENTFRYLRYEFDSGKKVWFTEKGIRLDIVLGNEFWGLYIPKDAFKKAGEIIKMGRITLCVLQPIDLAITKINRGNEIDYEDLKPLVIVHGFDHKKMIERYFTCKKTGPPKVYYTQMLKLYEIYFKKWKQPSRSLTKMVEKWKPKN